MRRKRMQVILAVLVTVTLCFFGCNRKPETGPGGLTESDFVKISANGFDAQDQLQDNNDYPWAMEHFIPDGVEDGGYLYVGIWSRVQQWKGFQRNRQPAYPEIRRYRPDISSNTWETVLDTRNLDLDDYHRPHGFRALKAYRNASDGRLCLYAGGRGDTTTLWRTETGEPGSWELFWELDRPGSIRGLTVHNDLLYMSFYDDYGIVDNESGEATALILASDGERVWTVLDNGFGNKHNVGIFTVESFNGWLYAGTHNPLQGGQVWKLEGPDPEAPPVKLVSGGGPRWLNESFLTMHVWKDHLYVGAQASFLMRMIGGLKAADVIRIDRNDNWEAVTGRCSIGGERSGFGEPSNAYIWSMCEHDGWFYIGTYDIMPGLSYMLTHPGFVLDIMGVDCKTEAPEDKLLLLTSVEMLFWRQNFGADLYKTQDGRNWYAVNLNGFGNPNNYGVRSMMSVNGQLILGLSNPYDGLEMWAGE